MALNIVKKLERTMGWCDNTRFESAAQLRYGTVFYFERYGVETKNVMKHFLHCGGSIWTVSASTVQCVSDSLGTLRASLFFHDYSGAAAAQHPTRYN